MSIGFTTAGLQYSCSLIGVSPQLRRRRFHLLQVLALGCQLGTARGVSIQSRRKKSQANGADGIRFEAHNPTESIAYARGTFTGMVDSVLAHNRVEFGNHRDWSRDCFLGDTAFQGRIYVVGHSIYVDRLCPRLTSKSQSEVRLIDNERLLFVEEVSKKNCRTANPGRLLLLRPRACRPNGKKTC